jgi:hypothetical protein
METGLIIMLAFIGLVAFYHLAYLCYRDSNRFRFNPKYGIPIIDLTRLMIEDLVRFLKKR